MGSSDYFCAGCSRRLNIDQQSCPECATPRADLIAATLPTPTAQFDPHQPIGERNRLPADCIWNERPYPGPVPDDARRAWDVPARFARLGTLSGRPAQEIINVVGPPNSIGAITGGGCLRQWLKPNPVTGYHYAVSFDPYDICIGITYQSDND
ncbi:MAG TPA: hypothetical protein VE442_13185 [Jatrophihabitans sp.]|jgi:hypothetical protein|nr:hypothetical protein [Jatrophihabitans sp.]